MRRFLMFACAALALFAMFGGSYLVEARDDPREHCAICDDGAYRTSKNKALVYFHVAGVEDGGAHRGKTYQMRGGSGFVFKEGENAKARVCTARHVVAPLGELQNGVFVMYLWNMEDAALVYVAAYSAKRDLAILDFADPDYVYPGDVLELGDDAGLAEGDDLTAIGAPESHCFMESTGILYGRYKYENGADHLRHGAKIAAGSSGGPLLDVSGKVVGVNVASFEKGHKFYPGSLAAPVSDLKDMLALERKKEKKR